MKCLGVLILVAVALSASAEEPLVRGLAVYAGDDERNFPVLVRTRVDADGRASGRYGHITIQFDVLAQHPPDLRIHFYHCNRDWKVDNNSFVADKNHTRSFTLNYAPSPAGVQGYAYRYINAFPDADELVRFEFSGNWIFQVVNKNEDIVHAEGRFIVVDDLAQTTVSVTNAYLTTEIPPFNQVHKLIARVKLPQEIDGIYYTTADVYQNRRMYNPYRIDMWDKNPFTHVDGQNTGSRIFQITNMMPGNEYRVFDLSNTTRYPNRAVARNRDGADQVRMYWRTNFDRNGIATANEFTGLASEYLDVMFRLSMTASDYRVLTQGGKEVFVAGMFNHWNPTYSDRLQWSESERAYAVTMQLRRGIYDYQYITGRWDATAGRVVEQDWTAIEGNDWRTSNTYRVFVYYNDPRFGGFDRIVGMGVAESVSELPGSD